MQIKIMEKQLFVVTFTDDYPYFDYKKIWAHDKDEALDLFEAEVGISRKCVAFVEADLDWISKNE